MLYSSNLSAQTPNIITYQGKLTQHGADVSGERTITARLYGNADGTEKVWEGTYKTYITDGIFALTLGAGKYPLPAPTKLDKQLWVGITVDDIELRPLTQLTSSPYALNVADKSITKAKLADELVGTLGTQDPQTNANGNSYWYENGNYAISNTGSDYLGTKDSSYLLIKVGADSSTNGGYGRVMWYLPNGTSANILGGHNSNYIGNGFGNVISGGGRYLHPNKIASNASSSYAFLGGGEDNILDGVHAVLVGGENDTVVGNNSFLGGGRDNNVGTSTNSSDESVIIGGVGNTTTGDRATILGGQGLTLSGDNVVGFNASIGVTFSGSNAMFLNDIDVRIGNTSNSAKRLIFHEPSSDATGNITTFKAQTQTADIEYILPNAQGATNTFLKNDGSGTLSWADPLANGVNAWNLTGNSGTTSVGSGGTNFLGTIDDKAFEIHVNRSGDSSQGRRRVVRYEPNNVSPNIIGGFNGNSITLGRFGSVIAGGGKLGEENNIEQDFGFIGGGSFNDVVDSFGVIVGGKLNTTIGSYSAIVGGFQNVASSKPLQFIGGGLNNSVAGYASFIGGGGGEFNHDSTDMDTDSLDFNLADAAWVTITGGRGNHARGIYNFIGGGRRNLIEKGVESDSSDFGFNTISGGEQNKIKWPEGYEPPPTDSVSILGDTLNTHHSFIGGGKNNTIESQYSVITGGDSNRIFSNSLDTLNGFVNRYSFIGGGQNNRINTDSDGDGTEENEFAGTVIVGGINNEAAERGAFIGAGENNIASEDFASLVGGRRNESNIFSFVGGGERNKITGGAFNVIGGGSFNFIDGGKSNFIGGGGKEGKFSTAKNSFGDSTEGNTIRGNFSTIVGGVRNNINTDLEFGSIGGGWKNTIAGNAISGRGFFATIPGGLGLRTQSFAQTVIGSYNLTLDSSTISNFLTKKRENDRIFVIGNGTPPTIDTVEATAVRRNAFEVSNNGHTIVFDNLGRNQGATTLIPPDTSKFSTRPAIRGARYIDNTPVAWGRFEANKLITSFGVDTNSANTAHTGLGVYKITLDYVDPYNSSQTLIQHGSSVVATIENTDDYSCLFINASPVLIQNGKNVIFIRISRQTVNDIPPIAMTCSAFNADFMFQVMGRQ